MNCWFWVCYGFIYEKIMVGYCDVFVDLLDIVLIDWVKVVLLFKVFLFLLDLICVVDMVCVICLCGIELI